MGFSAVSDVCVQRYGGETQKVKVSLRKTVPLQLALSVIVASVLVPATVGTNKYNLQSRDNSGTAFVMS